MSFWFGGEGTKKGVLAQIEKQFENFPEYMKDDLVPELRSIVEKVIQKTSADVNGIRVSVAGHIGGPSTHLQLEVQLKTLYLDPEDKEEVNGDSTA